MMHTFAILSAFALAYVLMAAATAFAVFAVYFMLTTKLGDARFWKCIGACLACILLSVFAALLSGGM